MKHFLRAFKTSGESLDAYVQRKRRKEKEIVRRERLLMRRGDVKASNKLRRRHK